MRFMLHLNCTGNERRLYYDPNPFFDFIAPKACAHCHKSSLFL